MTARARPSGVLAAAGLTAVLPMTDLDRSPQPYVMKPCRSGPGRTMLCHFGLTHHRACILHDIIQVSTAADVARDGGDVRDSVGKIPHSSVTSRSCVMVMVTVTVTVTVAVARDTRSDD